jgi:predicted Fe-Mo cluster-binding NifX family protein
VFCVFGRLKMKIKTAVFSILMIMIVSACSSVESPTGAAVNEIKTPSKIGVAALGDNENSRVSNGIGKAEYFLIFEDGILVNSVENTAGTGACEEAIQFFLEEEVDMVVCGKFGVAIMGYLNEAGIGEFTARGRLARDAVADIMNGVSADDSSRPKGSRSKQSQ